jgi:hypothetical protein
LIAGRKAKVVFVPKCIFSGTEAIRCRFLRGLFDCDGSVMKSGSIDYASISKELIDGIRLLLFDLGIKNKYYFRKRKARYVKRRIVVSNDSDVHRITINEWDSRKIFADKIGFVSSLKMNRLLSGLAGNRYFDSLDRDEQHWTQNSSVIAIRKVGNIDFVVDFEVKDNNNYVVNGVLSHNSQGSGKSYAAIACCAILDPNFSIDHIYFDYNDLVYDRKSLKPHTAVLVDEQTESYGVDSHRVNIILGALKEQLRKKSIHFFFCSPTLKEEFRTSQYVLETMFIDYEEQVSYCAYKTRELLTLGYVKIPHPLKFVSKEFLAAYEAKKDAHLDKLTGVKQVDEIEDRAKIIMDAPLFRKAEILYKRKMGYIPMGSLFQIINKLYPEFRSSIIVGELAQRIKLNKELNGEWTVSGGFRQKKKQSEL